MKRSSRSQTIKNLYLLPLALFLLPFLTGVSLARASDDPNALLAFKKIYVEPIQDNVEGVFQAPVEESFNDIFKRNPRFELVPDKASSDTVLRTVLNKKTTGIDIEISLTLSRTDEVFSSDTMTVAASATGKETGNAVKQLLKTTLKRIPFYGTITGRDQTSLTFDIGAAHGLKKGDVIQISRIDSVKRHPLLKSIVDVQLVPVGNAAVDEAEDTIAFGHIYSEIPGEKIERYHKITAVEARLPEVTKESLKVTAAEPSRDAFAPPPVLDSVALENASDESKPELGLVELGVFLGSFSGSSSQNNGTSNYSGAAFSPGVKLAGELWLTQRWFVDLAFAASTMSYYQAEALESTADRPGVSSSTRSFALNVGYKYMPTRNIFGPQVFVKLGYANFTWDTQVNAARLLSPKSYSGLNLGVGGKLPLGTLDWGVALNVNVLLFPSLDEDGFSTGGSPSPSGVNFFFGGYHRFTETLAVKAGFQFDTYSAEFNDGISSTNQKQIGFLPSILYYF